MAKKQSLSENPNVKTIQLNSDKDSEIRFDINLLNDSPFKRILQYWDSVSSSPLEYLLTGLIASLSGAIGKNVFFEITSSMKIFLNCWAVAIGPSSVMRKTSALNICKEDLQRIEAVNYTDYKKRFSEYEKEIERFKNNKDRVNEIDKPIRRHILFPNDATIEALSEILSNSDRGLLTHSEFGSFLLQLNRGYSADAKQFLTTIFDIPETYEVSRATKNNTFLQCPYLSILGASTIDWIKENSTETDLRSGFFARMLFSIRNTPDKPFIPLLKLKELTRQSEHYINTREIFDYLVSINDFIPLDITKAAAELHINFDIDSYVEMLNSMNENEMSFKARLAIYSIKFAGILALTDRRTTVNIKDMEDAIVITEYYKKNVERLLNNELMTNEFTIKEDKIYSKIKASEGGVILHKDLLNSVSYRSKELEEIIKNLVEKERIEIIYKKNEYNNRSGKYYKTK